MATLAEKRELVEDIKRPVRLYRIVLSGYGSETYYANSSKEEYDFWVTEIKKRRVEVDLEDHKDPFEQYMLCKEDEPDSYEYVPKDIKRRDEYYDYSNIAFVQGPEYDSAYISIEEIEIVDYQYNVLETVAENVELSDFILDNNNDSESKDITFKTDYVYTAVIALKGKFFEGLVETNGRIDLSKLAFNMIDTYCGESIVSGIAYNGEHIEYQDSDVDDMSTEIRLVNMKE
jgi:hypothetical protein